MSNIGERTAETYRRTTSLIPWFTLFIVLKLYGPAAAWSWWWLLIPTYPDLVILLHRVGMF